MAQHRLVTEGLDVPRLKLVMGLSLGGMLTWMFGGMFPDFMDALVPVASQPGPMSGRNWIQRRINVEAIRNDPEWKGGDYETQPTGWARVAPLSAMFTQSVVRIQEIGVDAGKGRRVLPAAGREREEGRRQRPALSRSSRRWTTTRPPISEKIRAKLFAINFADDAVNPPELGVLEAGVARIPGARCVVVPATPQSLGHQSSMHAALWKGHLAEFLKRSEAGVPGRQGPQSSMAGHLFCKAAFW